MSLHYRSEYGPVFVQFLFVTILLSVFQYVLGTTITGVSTSRVDASSKGTLLGLEHCLFAAARVFAPTMGISILNAGGVSHVCGVCAVIFLAVTAVWNIFDNKQASFAGGTGESKGDVATHFDKPKAVESSETKDKLK